MINPKKQNVIHIQKCTHSPSTMTDSAVDGVIEMVSSVWRLTLNASTSSISPVIELKHNRKVWKRFKFYLSIYHLIPSHHWPQATVVAESEVGAVSVLLPAGSSGQDGHACSWADSAIGGEARLPGGCEKTRGGTEEPWVPEMPAEAVTLTEKPQRRRHEPSPSFILPVHHQAHLLSHAFS